MKKQVNCEKKRFNSLISNNRNSNFIDIAIDCRKWMEHKY